MLIKDFDPLKHMDFKTMKRSDIFTQYAIYAAKEAYLDAKLDTAEYDSERFACITGSGIGGLETLNFSFDRYYKGGITRIPPLFLATGLINISTGSIAIQLGAKGFSSSIVTACATGSSAIGDAFNAIQRDDADLAVAGGADFCINFKATPQLFLIVGTERTLK